MVDRHFVERLVNYMQNDRSLTLKEKCNKFDISPQTYYRLCKKHGIDGRVGPRLNTYNQDKFVHIFEDFAKKEASLSEVNSSTSECTSSQDETQLSD